jgi:hypothetical protein
MLWHGLHERQQTITVASYQRLFFADALIPLKWRVEEIPQKKKT